MFTHNVVESTLSCNCFLTNVEDNMAKVTVRFFKIEKIHNSAPDLEVALKNVFATGSKASEREKTSLGAF